METPRLSDRQLQAFQHVMECGSVSGAARRMLIAQPGVTRLVKQLEHDVGFTLFERRRGRLVATPEARLFHRELLRVWSGLEGLRATARRIKERETGGLRISAMPLLGMGFLPDVLADFTPRHGEAPVELATFRSEQVVEDIVTQRADLGFAMLGGGDERVESEAFSLGNVCLLPADHPLTAQSSITLDDLHDQPLICYEPQDPSRRALDRLLEAAGVRPRRHLQVSLALQAARLVTQGAGITVIDPLNARVFADERLAIRPFAAELDDTFYLLTPREQPLSRLAQDFISVFRAQFARAIDQSAKPQS
ncbi:MULTISPECIES: LysR family transcriptional regulator [unclassified Halomonas]|uniref:LysR family transcriptional regulator n=1 Tax=unclassified Halomonas TaxID=2609666 RepID=UPI002888D05D|nr:MULTISPECIES: LysR family transcriptional regulator [unclassified Halomonas]MDT0501124.1 LysR family transcriptional regulator [Halomonas sp. PAR7]MDT0513315.1 LysR family transcriptional regulator [Halomonas sp. LES1]MDT0592172.1 LysR family transcriptional regulator [Halomonas sp. PAR8]